MGQIESLERQLRDLAKSMAVAIRRGGEDEWLERYERFKREVRQALELKEDLNLRKKLKILLGIEILDDVLRGMQEDRRREE